MTSFYALTPEGQAECMKALALRALRHWHLDGSDLCLIKMRENAVFQVDTPQGGRRALRIHRYGYHSDAGLRSELQWMQALDDSGIDVPSVIPTTDNRLFAVVHVDEVPEPRQVDLFKWVEGRQLGQVAAGLQHAPVSMSEIFRTIGRIAARLHNQATSWRIPPGFTRHAWDVDGLTGEQPLWGRFWELAALSPSQRRLMEQVRRTLREQLDAYGQCAETYSLIHADFVPENLLVDGQCVRLIDFDDAGFGWHLFELATSLFFHRGEDHFDAGKAALLEGYRSLRPLSDEQWGYLPLFMMARGTTYLGWAHTRKETQTARDLTPMLVDTVCRQAEEYLSG